MKMQLFQGAWCILRNGRVAGPVVSVVSASGHPYLVGGLFYSVGGVCQSGEAHDVVTVGETKEYLLSNFVPSADVISIASRERVQGELCSVDSQLPASLNSDAGAPRQIGVAVATSFGLISGEVAIGTMGAVSISAPCLQFANNDPMPISERALDRCGILRGDRWFTFAELLIEAATREIAA